MSAPASSATSLATLTAAVVRRAGAMGAGWLSGGSTRGLSSRSTQCSTRAPTTGDSIKEIMCAMTTIDYLINGLFVLIIFRQARERELDRRSVVLPLVLVAFVARMYIHSIPTAGNDLVLIGLLAAVGLTLGVIAGIATHVRAGSNGLAVARVGWLAGILLVFGITARMVFAFVVTHGGHHAIASFSIAHQITAPAWPVALVAMAVCEVTARTSTVQLRGHRILNSNPSMKAYHATLPIHCCSPLDRGGLVVGG